MAGLGLRVGLLFVRSAYLDDSRDPRIPLNGREHHLKNGDLQVFVRIIFQLRDVYRGRLQRIGPVDPLDVLNKRLLIRRAELAVLVELFLEQPFAESARFWKAQIFVEVFDAANIAHDAFTTM